MQELDKQALAQCWLKLPCLCVVAVHRDVYPPQGLVFLRSSSSTVFFFIIMPALPPFCCDNGCCWYCLVMALSMTFPSGHLAQNLEWEPLLLPKNNSNRIAEKRARRLGSLQHPRQCQAVMVVLKGASQMACLVPKPCMAGVVLLAVLGRLGAMVAALLRITTHHIHTPALAMAAMAAMAAIGSCHNVSLKLCVSVCPCVCVSACLYVCVCVSVLRFGGVACFWDGSCRF